MAPFGTSPLAYEFCPRDFLTYKKGCPAVPYLLQYLYLAIVSPFPLSLIFHLPSHSSISRISTSQTTTEMPSSLSHPRAILGLISCLGIQVLAQINLGTAAPFGILASTAITSTGNSVITGELGIFPNTRTSITGFPPGISGDVHAGDDVADQAQQDATAAYNAALGLTPTEDLTGKDLGGLTLGPGVYTASSSIGLTGALTLDGNNDSTAQFVFQIGSTLTTAAASSVVLINGAQACNVFWQVGSSATLGATTKLAGSILALTSISVGDGVSATGGFYALNAAVTLINDAVTVPQSCNSPSVVKAGDAVIDSPPTEPTIPTVTTLTSIPAPSVGLPLKDITIVNGVPCTTSKYYDSSCNCILTATVPLPTATPGANIFTVSGVPCTTSKYYESACDCIKTATVPVRTAGAGESLELPTKTDMACIQTATVTQACTAVPRYRM
jgi:hypothetical protein